MSEAEIIAIKDTNEFYRRFLWHCCKQINACQGILFKLRNDILLPVAGYALPTTELPNITIKIGDGFTGQVAADNKPMLIDSVPAGYLEITSGLGKKTPSVLYIHPFSLNEKISAVIELAGFDFNQETLTFFNSINNDLLKRLNE